MDGATLGQYSGYIAIVLSIASLIIGAVNHKRVRSNCCGREGVLVSLDIGPITPPEKPSISI